MSHANRVSCSIERKNFSRRRRFAGPRLSRRRRRSPLCRPRRRRLSLRRRRQPLPRLLRLLGADDPRPRLSACGRSHPARRPRAAPASAPPRRRGRSRRAGARAAFPSVEKLRFVSSGTEAACPPSAWRAASPGATSSSNSKAATTATPTPCWSRPAPASPRFGIPGSAGVPEETAHAHAGAALQRSRRGRSGLRRASGRDRLRHRRAGRRQRRHASRPRPAISQALRELTREHGALLIFDEVMTGFRALARRSAAALRHHSPTSPRWARSSAAACPAEPSADAPISWTFSPRLARSIRPEPSAAIRWRWLLASPPSAT